MQTRALVSMALFLSAGSFLCVDPGVFKIFLETGKLKVHVEPKQAYVFVDGKAIREGSQTIKLAPGSHNVSVYNYGYEPKTEGVRIDAGKKADLNIALQSSGDKVAGPFAEIEFKGDPRAAVLLNGQTPAYFVGHVDEFNWDWIWHQRLLLKPGTYQVTVTREGNTIWSGPVIAKAGQHVTVYLDRNGQTKTQEWKAGLAMGPQPRFKVGIASATVPIAPVSAQLSAQNQGYQLRAIHFSKLEFHERRGYFHFRHRTGCRRGRSHGNAYAQHDLRADGQGPGGRSHADGDY